MSKVSKVLAKKKPQDEYFSTLAEDSGASDNDNDGNDGNESDENQNNSE